MSNTLRRASQEHSPPNGWPHGAAPKQVEIIMKSRWWNFFDGMAEIAFKPAAGGYVYRAPSLWPFVSGGHYTVNEQQKAELAGHHLRMLRALFWLIVAGGAIGGPLVGAFWSGNLWMGLAIAGLVGLAIGLGASGWLLHKVRPIIATLKPTGERITQGESFKAQARAYSTPTLVALMIIDIVLVVAAAMMSISGSSEQIVMGWLGVIFFGASAIYMAALYVSKCKQAAA